MEKDEGAETDAEVFAGLKQSIASAEGAPGLTFAMIVILGREGYVNFMRSMEHANGRDLREAAGLLFGYAVKLTEAADAMEGQRVLFVPRHHEPDPNAS